MKNISSLIWISVCVMFCVFSDTGFGSEAVKKIVLESKIGIGFGKVVEVEGQIKTGKALGLRSKADETRLFLNITTLEGKKIEHVVLIFWASPDDEKKLGEDERPVRLWGYESVEASGIAIGEYTNEDMPAGTSWAARSIFVITRVGTAED